MDDRTFKEELSLFLGEPPEAPAGEFFHIVTRIEKRKRRVWQFGLVPAVTFALVVVLFVEPERTPKQPQNFFSVVEDISIGMP